jgi:hypothetical protein
MHPKNFGTLGVILWMTWSAAAAQTADELARRWTLRDWAVEPPHSPLAARISSMIGNQTPTLTLDLDGSFSLRVGNQETSGQWQWIPEIRSMVFIVTGDESVRAQAEGGKDKLYLIFRDGGTTLRTLWDAG